MLKSCFMFLGITGALGILLLSGCKTEEDYRRERAEKAVRYFEVSKFQVLDSDVRLTLPECVSIALKNNLDIKVFNLEEDIAYEMRTAEVLGMLPELNINNNFSGRSNVPASSSEAYAGDGATYGASQNQDKNINFFNIDLALSVMDFGLAFFNSQQAQDRLLLRKQHTERMAQNLTLDVVRAYCRVAAAQRAIDITRGLLETCRDRYTLISNLAKAKQITPFRAFDETRKFIEMERRLTAYILDYQNSCVELRSLLGYYPSANITVDDSFLDATPAFHLPDLEVMEQIALIKRPELRKTDIQRHINVIECRKAILTMFPTARVFLDYDHSNNSFLYKQNWMEFGIQATFNLLKLPQKVSQAMAYSRQADAELIRSFGESITIIAEVRIAHSDIMANKDLLEQCKKSYENFKNTLVAAQKNRNISAGDLSRLEIDHMRLTTAEANIEQTLALGNYYISFYRLLNSLGMRDVTPKSFDKLSEELKSAQKEAGVILANAAAAK
ncbi:MAG: Outer membrane efflux protein [Lentisphaerae bacterium ADurb.Bin242]|nr:MAG: Outer membrane efflux protein [Lentisphaerae bacterium ADurb.Bin242]